MNDKKSFGDTDLGKIRSSLNPRYDIDARLFPHGQPPPDQFTASLEGGRGQAGSAQEGSAIHAPISGGSRTACPSTTPEAANFPATISAGVSQAPHGGGDVLRASPPLLGPICPTCKAWLVWNRKTFHWVCQCLPVAMQCLDCGGPAERGPDGKPLFTLCERPVCAECFQGAVPGGNAQEEMP